jgi:cobalt-zinc-cadmium resistance protein CzcA
VVGSWASSLTITRTARNWPASGLNVSDVNTIVETAIGGKAATQVIQGERQFDLVVRMQDVPKRPERHQNLAHHHAGRPASAAQPVRRYQGGDRRIVHLSRIEFALRRRQFSVEAATAAPSAKARKKVDAAVKLPSGTAVRGAASITRNTWRRRSR